MKFDFPCGKNAYLMVADGMWDPTISTQLIDECVRYYDTLFEPGPTMAGLDTRVKSSMDFNFGRAAYAGAGMDPTLLSHIETVLTECLWSAIAKYIETYRELMYWPGISDSGFRLQHSPKNRGYYRPHCDAMPWDSVGDAVSNRVAAVIMYLNDVETGGGTHFPEHDYICQARTGRIAIFPTYWTHPHAGMVPLDGDKWIISTFLSCSRQPLSPFQEEADSLEIAEVDDSESQEETE